MYTYICICNPNGIKFFNLINTTTTLLCGTSRVTTAVAAACRNLNKVSAFIVMSHCVRMAAFFFSTHTMEENLNNREFSLLGGA